MKYKEIHTLLIKYTSLRKKKLHFFIRIKISLRINGRTSTFLTLIEIFFLVISQFECLSHGGRNNYPKKIVGKGVE